MSNKKIRKLQLVTFLIIISTIAITQKVVNSPEKMVEEYKIHTYTQKISLTDSLGSEIVEQKVSGLETKMYGLETYIPLPRSLKKNSSGKYIMYLPNLKQGVYTISTINSKLIIKVGNSKKIADPSLEKCPLDHDTEESCLVDYYIALYEKNKNLNSILSDILLNKDSTPGFATLCHNVIHDLGIYYVIKNKTLSGLDVEQASICDNALLHGAEEGLALSWNNDELSKKFAKLCKEGVLKKLDNCEHGLGHLAYWRTGDFKLGMKLCMLLEETTDSYKNSSESDTINCADGVSMSQLTDFDVSKNDLSPLNDYEEPIIVFDAIAQCLSLKDDLLLQGCLSNINFFYHKGDERKVKNLCDRLEGINHDKCYISLGRLAGTYDTLQATGELCNTIENSAMGLCLAQAILWYYQMQPNNIDNTNYYCTMYSDRFKVCEYLRLKSLELRK